MWKVFSWCVCFPVFGLNTEICVFGHFHAVFFRYFKNRCTVIKQWRGIVWILKRAFNHCVKSVQIRSYIWSIFSCIQSEYRKIRTRNNSVFGRFSHSESIKRLINKNANVSKCFRYRLQILFMIISEFKQIKELLLPLEPSAVIE